MYFAVSNMFIFFCILVCCLVFISAFIFMFFWVGLLIMIFCNCVIRVLLIVLINVCGIIICWIVVYFCLVFVVILCIILWINSVNFGWFGVIFLFSMQQFRELVFIVKGIDLVMIFGWICSICLVVVDFVKVIIFWLFRWFNKLLVLL